MVLKPHNAEIDIPIWKDNDGAVFDVNDHLSALLESDPNALIRFIEGVVKVLTPSVR